MQEGIIKLFNKSKGFGFIRSDNGGDDIFFHSSGLIDKVDENDRVIFDLQRTLEGIVAINIKKI